MSARRRQVGARSRELRRQSWRCSLGMLVHACTFSQSTIDEAMMWILPFIRLKRCSVDMCAPFFHEGEIPLASPKPGAPSGSLVCSSLATRSSHYHNLLLTTGFITSVFQVFSFAVALVAGLPSTTGLQGHHGLLSRTDDSHSDKGHSLLDF